MHTMKRFALSLALVTLLGMSVAAVASAETVLNGSFTLPEQTYWGNTLLPAGEYSLLVVRGISGVNEVIVRGDGVTATIMAPAGAEDISDRSCLKVDAVNGTYVVRELDAGFLGKSYRFIMGKAVREKVMSSAAQPISVPLVAAGM